MKIISWNVNGLRAVHKKGFVDWLSTENPDIICLQETKAEEAQVPDEIKDMADYHKYFCSGEKKGYSGVAMFSKPQPVEVRKSFGVEKFDSEGRILMSDFGSFKLFGIYFPNGSASAERLQYKMEFYEAFLEELKKLLEKGEKIVICGDVNTAHTEIDLARPKENQNVSGFLPIEREWIGKLLAAGFIDTFRVFNQDNGNYTWWDMKTRARERNVGWRLDYFFISENLRDNLKSATILKDVMGSDHCPIGIEIDL